MSTLFAQFGKNANGNQDLDKAVAIGVLIGVCIFLLIVLIIYIFFLLTLSKALSRCRPNKRTMEPGLVWLNLIPCFSLVWMFITVIRIAESLRREFRARGRTSDGDYGYSIGLTMCGLNVASIPISFVLGLIPIIGPILNLCLNIVELVLWIVYWVKIAGYSKQLLSRDFDDDEEDNWDDEEHDRPRKRHDEDDDDDEDDEDDRPRNLR
jgi:hypothetical protein